MLAPSIRVFKDYVEISALLNGSEVRASSNDPFIGLKGKGNKYVAFKSYEGKYIFHHTIEVGSNPFTSVYEYVDEADLVKHFPDDFCKSVLRMFI